MSQNWLSHPDQGEEGVMQEVSESLNGVRRASVQGRERQESKGYELHMAD